MKTLIYKREFITNRYFMIIFRLIDDRGKLTYFLDYDIMEAGINTPKMQGNLGFRIRAHPEASDQTLAYYRVLDFHSSLADINKILHPNETVMIEIMLQRRVDKTVSRITNNLTPKKFSKKPIGQKVD